jgi:hypothetical protein
MSPHRLRRGALHLPARRSRQNVNLFLRKPLINIESQNQGEFPRFSHPCLFRPAGNSITY